MKKLIACLVLIALIGGLLLFGGRTSDMGGPDSAYLRIHIRADSNEAAAQAVKYKVRDAVVELLTPLAAQAESKEAAIRALTAALPRIERTAEAVLGENGFPYGARASIRKEEFPTRVYEGVTLGAGVYDALILELGSGNGDNWWCVVYPPLCFTGGGGNVVYRSRIAEIIRNFFGR